MLSYLVVCRNLKYDMALPFNFVFRGVLEPIVIAVNVFGLWCWKSKELRVSGVAATY